MTERRIRDWVHEWGQEGVYVAFSGGKDSTVLLDIVRNRCGFDEVPAVFVDTGLEYPEIRDFVKTFDNVVWLKPKMTFKAVIEKYGYPFISKEISDCVYSARKYIRALNKGEIPKNAYALADLLGVERRKKGVENREYEDLKTGKLPIRVKQMMGVMPHRVNGVETNEYSKMYDKSRYMFFLNAPFEIAPQCCKVMKKGPAHKYGKESGRYAITGQMAEESRLRQSQWIQHGCNMYDVKIPVSNPLSFWTEQDVLRYIKENNIRIASVYGDVVVDYGDECEGQLDFSDFGLMPNEKRYKTTGCQRTGCMFCGFGCHIEKGVGRFARMKETHPQLYDYIMRPKEKGGLNYKEVIDWTNENGNFNIRY